MATREPTDRSSEVVRPSRTDADRRHQQRVIAAGAIGPLVVVFALINLNDVKVHWLIATGQTPLIVVDRARFPARHRRGPAATARQAKARRGVVSPSCETTGTDRMTR